MQVFNTLTTVKQIDEITVQRDQRAARRLMNYTLEQKKMFCNDQLDLELLRFVTTNDGYPVVRAVFTDQVHFKNKEFYTKPKEIIGGRPFFNQSRSSIMINECSEIKSSTNKSSEAFALHTIRNKTFPYAYFFKVCSKLADHVCLSVEYIQ